MAPPAAIASTDELQLASAPQAGDSKNMADLAEDIKKLNNRLNELFAGQWEGIQKILHELAEIKSELKKLSEKPIGVERGRKV
jgi:archaellum component FlaC